MPLLILLGFCFLPSHSLAAPVPDFVGHIMRWNITPSTGNLNYYIDPTVSSTYATWAQSGFSQWQGVTESYLTFTQVTSITSANILIKGYNSISNDLVPMQAAPKVAADGSLQTCEVQITIGSDTPGQYTTQYLQSGVTHEIGHCLGLQHSLAPDAVMSYLSSSPLSLATDDHFALALLYPKDGQTQYPLGCATISSDSKQPPSKFRKSKSQALQGIFECSLQFLLMALFWQIQLRSKTAAREVKLR